MDEKVNTKRNQKISPVGRASDQLAGEHARHTVYGVLVVALGTREREVVTDAAEGLGDEELEDLVDEEGEVLGLDTLV
jgi:hypothetical protein